ncbi:MAG: hypothetical protein EOM83_09105, partial [Clostridia bacterium]|nr:hypothetical protein [Clostridia bacterium]
MNAEAKRRGKMMSCFGSDTVFCSGVHKELSFSSLFPLFALWFLYSASFAKKITIEGAVNTEEKRRGKMMSCFGSDTVFCSEVHEELSFSSLFPLFALWFLYLITIAKRITAENAEEKRRGKMMSCFGFDTVFCSGVHEELSFSSLFPLLALWFLYSASFAKKITTEGEVNAEEKRRGKMMSC